MRKPREDGPPSVLVSATPFRKPTGWRMWQVRSTSAARPSRPGTSGTEYWRRQSRSQPRQEILLLAKDDAALGQVVGRHFDDDRIPLQNADAVLAHLAGGMRQNFMIVFQSHAKHR